ncbi:hypothetical protein [Luethyella okanaganae]|uniref:TetR family transcriptional regulator n=1 Tax=Luethyella okanaganae TaxID=69372 RepID=A0ABW1VHV3_9MICO
MVCDLLVGPLLARALLPLTAPLDDQFARQTAQVALDYLTADSSAKLAHAR